MREPTPNVSWKDGPSDRWHRPVSVRRVLTLLGLVLAWCALWGSFGVANVLSGVVVGVVAMAFGVGGSGRGGIRLIPLAKFTWLVAVDMVASTANVIREVLTPTDYTEEGIIAVEVPAGCRHHLLLLFVAITVTPGTAVVAADADRSVLYLHVLHCSRRREVEEHVRELADLANEALPNVDEEPSTDGWSPEEVST